MNQYQYAPYLALPLLQPPNCLQGLSTSAMIRTAGSQVDPTGCRRGQLPPLLQLGLQMADSATGEPVVMLLQHLRVAGEGQALDGVQGTEEGDNPVLCHQERGQVGEGTGAAGGQLTS